MFDWPAQSKASPIAVDRAKGVYFYGIDGNRYLDFNSQLMEREHRARRPPRRSRPSRGRPRSSRTSRRSWPTRDARSLGPKLAELLPGDIEKTFFTLGGAEANENAIRIARLVTGRHKILARYR